MAQKTPGKPKSYDDIVRATVVEPDSSSRPSRNQEAEAREGYRALDNDEAALEHRVQSALAALGGDASQVTAEISRGTVALRGRVARADLLRAVEDAVARIPGVDSIHDQIVVGA